MDTGVTIAILSAIVGAICLGIFAYLIFAGSRRRPAARPEAHSALAGHTAASTIGVVEFVFLLLGIVLLTGGAFRLALGP